MRNRLRLTTALLPTIMAAAFFTAGCRSTPEEEPDMADRYIAAMDAKPAEERVPKWEETKALMNRRAPQVGEVAPDFELPREDGSGTARLSSLCRERPVILVFGSYT